MIKLTRFTFIIFIGLIFNSCEPIANQFDDFEDAVMYESLIIKEFPSKKTIKVMTWNIRFGVARLRFFGDGCGDRVIMTKKEVLLGLEGLANKIKIEDPDILLLQEVDIQSKKTAYIDQAQWLLDNTEMNYGAYASMWQSQVILADGLGRVNTGNLILSKWKLKDAERYQLALREDQDGLTKYFYLKRNVLKAKVEMPNNPFYAVNTHLTAFAEDDSTKLRHINGFKNILDGIVADGQNFVAGGDLNALPTNASKLDYCLEDQCENESYHSDKEPGHKPGAYFAKQIDGLSDLYKTYEPAISLEEYGANELKHFTHSPDNKLKLDRKLDYLWTNTSWANSITHQEATTLSDHIPVSALWDVK